MGDFAQNYIYIFTSITDVIISVYFKTFIDISGKFKQFFAFITE